MDPKCISLQREVEGDDRRREGNVTIATYWISETEVTHPRNTGSHQNVEEARSGFSPRASRGRMALLTP